MIVGLENLIAFDEIKDFEAAVRRHPDRCVRIRADRNSESVPFPLERVPWFEGGYWLPDPSIRPGGYLPYAVADYYIQDAASLLPIRLASIEPDDWVCDLCAAPGGKATAVAEKLGGQGVLIANEAIRSRLDVLKYALSRTGRANYATCNFDPEAMQLRCSQLFNKVLVDAPCSGQSLVGRDKQNDAAFSERQIEHCAARARRILRSAISLLRPGGLLIFSTCTFSVEENEAQIEWLQSEYPNAWEPVEDPFLAAWKSPISAGCYRMWPHRDRCSGGFAAAMKLTSELPRDLNARVDQGPDFSSRQSSNRNRLSVSSNKAARENDKHAADFLQSLGVWAKAWQLDERDVFVLEDGMEGFLARHGDAFRPCQVAIQVGKHFEPTQALAMIHDRLFQPAKRLDLDSERAKSFMAGECLMDPQATNVFAKATVVDASTSWTVAQWEGKPLGWLKRSASRYNNHLPAWARMRILP